MNVFWINTVDTLDVGNGPNKHAKLSAWSFERGLPDAKRTDKRSLSITERKKTLWESRDAQSESRGSSLVRGQAGLIN